MKRTLASISLMLLAAVALVAGCNERTNDKTAPAVSRLQEQPKPTVVTLVIPAGTSVVASLDTGVNTETNHTGDSFVATTTEPIVVGGKTVVPAGAQIRGALSDVQASGRISGRAHMTLGFNEIVDAGGKSHAITARPLTVQAASKTHSDVEKIAAGGVLGAIVGGIAGGGKGAAIGAGVGAGAGTILMVATQGADVQLNPGQRLNILMRTPVSIQVAQR